MYGVVRMLGVFGVGEVVGICERRLLRIELDGQWNYKF